MAEIIEAWAGFIDDRIGNWTTKVRVYDEPRLAVFRREADAKRAYGDVRKIEIRVLD